MNEIEYILRWEIRKRENMEYPTENDREKIILGSYGNLGMNLNEIEELDRICHEYGYSIVSFIRYIIEHLTIDEINDILFKMDMEPRTED